MIFNPGINKTVYVVDNNGNILTGHVINLSMNVGPETDISMNIECTNVTQIQNPTYENVNINVFQRLLEDGLLEDEYVDE